MGVPFLALRLIAKEKKESEESKFGFLSLRKLQATPPSTQVQLF
jgi:hypothetical protein